MKIRINFIYGLLTLWTSLLLAQDTLPPSIGPEVYLGPRVIIQGTPTIKGPVRITGSVTIKDSPFISADKEILIQGPENPENPEDQIVISGLPSIVGNVKIAGSGHIGQSAWIGNSSIRGKNFLITDKSKVMGESSLHGENIQLRDQSQVWGKSQIGNNTILRDYVSIGAGTLVDNSELTGIVNVACEAFLVSNKKSHLPVPDFCRFPYTTMADIKLKNQFVEFLPPLDENAEICNGVGPSSARPNEVNIVISNPHMDNAISVISEQEAVTYMDTILNKSGDNFHVDFPHDGCFNRAHLFALVMEEKYGLKMAKIFLDLPIRISSVFAGKLFGWDQCEVELESEGAKWTYHTAAMTLVEKIDPETQEKTMVPMIFDPLTSAQPVSEEEWVRFLSSKLQPHQLARIYYSHRFSADIHTSDMFLSDYASVNTIFDKVPTDRNVPRDQIKAEIKGCFSKLRENFECKK